MSPKDIISSIESIYDRFEVPSKIRAHCRLVASVASRVCSQVGLDKESSTLVIAASLVHDLGNIIKVDFDSDLAKELYSFQEREQLRITRERIISCYGSHEDLATIAMLNELSCDKSVISLLKSSTWVNVLGVLSGDSLPEKILSYADYRVGPFGIVSLQERLDDLNNRYKGRHAKSSFSKDDVDARNKSYVLIEKQLVDLGYSPE